MRSVTVSTTLRTAPEHVFDFLVDNRNDELWCPMASDVRLVEGQPGAGAVYTFRQAGGIARNPVWLRTVVAERATRLVWDNADRGQSFTMEIRLTPAGSGTHVTHRNRVVVGDPVRQALWWASAHGVLRLQLRNLRRELER